MVPGNHPTPGKEEQKGLGREKEILK